MKRVLTISLIACTAAVQAICADEQLKDAREAVSQWVAVEQTLSLEASAWREKQAHLNNLIGVAKAEIAALEKQITEAKQSAGAADERRAELVQQQAESDAKEKLLQDFLAPAEKRLRGMKTRLPEPLQRKLAPFFRRLPARPDDAGSLGVAERMQSVVGILAAIQKFDSIVTVVEDIRKLDDGTTGEVRTIYFGLGAAYFLAAGGSDAGVGAPGPDGWAWQSRPELADAIRDAVGADDNDTIRIITPQFERPPNWPSPGAWVPDAADWDALRALKMEDLTALGFGNWDGGLALVPSEWHGRLPDGLALECISGEIAVVGIDYIDNDIRYGCIAYGIRVGPVIAEDC